MTSVKDTITRQYMRLANKAALQFSMFQAPKLGWVEIMRKALGMTAPELARRMGVTKAAIYQVERKELDGGVTLQQMDKLATALGGRFVYSIIPENSIEDMLKKQAHKKAENIIRRANSHMALEQQSLTLEKNNDEIEFLAEELLRKRPSDFWKEK